MEISNMIYGIGQKMLFVKYVRLKRTTTSSNNKRLVGKMHNTIQDITSKHCD